MMSNPIQEKREMFMDILILGASSFFLRRWNAYDCTECILLFPYY